jgi:hypothetical protein
MSGFLGEALSLSSVASSLFSGPSVSIGGINLSGPELPPSMPYPVSQELVVKKLPGGGKVVDAMGAYDGVITWSGRFDGSMAVSRVDAMLDIVRAAAVVTLQWGSESRQVVVSEFTPHWGSRGMMIAYEITCEVLPSVQAAAAPTMLSSLSLDIGNALGVPNITSDVSSALSTAQSALPVLAVLTKGSTTYQTLSSAVGSAQSVASSVQALAGLTITGAPASSGGSLFGSASNLLSVSSAMQVEASSTEALSYLGRAVKNLG